MFSGYSLLTRVVSALVVVTLLLPAVSMLFPSPASAQAGWRLIVLPNKREYLAWPGSQILGSVKIRNNGDEAIANLVPFAVDFGPNAEETGDPKILEGDEEYNGHELAAWMTFDQTPVTIEPDTSVDIEYVINVPPDAEAGGHYAMLYMQQVTPGEGQTAVGIRSRLGALVLLTVQGDIVVDGAVKEFYTGKKLYEYLPVDLYLRMENQGNVHFSPIGNIFITDWLDRSVGTIKINEGGGAVLPNSIRRYQAFWEAAFITNEFVRDAEGNVVRNEEGEREREIIVNWSNWNLFRFGRYEALAVVTYEDVNGNEIPVRAVTHFWVIPWKLILLILAVIMLVTVGVRYGMRRYNDRLIREYEKGRGLDYKEVTAERKKRQEKRVRREERRQRIKYKLGQWRDKALSGFGIRKQAEDSAADRPETPEAEAPVEKEQKKSSRSKNNESSRKSKQKEDKHSVFRDPDRLDWE